LVKKSISKTGKRQVTGVPKALRESGSYPIQFGMAIAALLNPFGEPKESTERVGENLLS